MEVTEGAERANHRIVRKKKKNTGGKTKIRKIIVINSSLLLIKFENAQ
jgi:hypothetical protein